MQFRPAFAVFVPLLAALSGPTAWGDIWYFEANITHDQHVPPTGSSATGHATLVYDDVANMLDAEVYIEGIRHEDLLFGHLHQGRVGFYGEMIAMLGHGHMWEPFGDGLRRIVTGLEVDELWEQDLLTDGAYVNIHTRQWESGEIRGGGRFTWDGATPSQTLALIFARNTGSFRIPNNNPCAGTPLGLGSNQIQLARTFNSAGGSGFFNATLPSGACGGYFQLLQLSDCDTSNVAQAPN